MMEPILTSELCDKFTLVCLGNLGTCDVLITVILAVVFVVIVFFPGIYQLQNNSYFVLKSCISILSSNH